MKIATAKNYAQALLGIDDEEKLNGSLISELKTVAEGINATPELYQVFTDNRVSFEQKREIVSQVFQKSISAEAANFINILIKNQSLNKLEEILRAAKKITLEKKLQLEFTAESVIPLAASQKKRITRYLENKFSKQVELTNRINTRIVGGIILKSEGILIDGSIQGRIVALKEKLKL